jgi:uncharacterized membrane protein YbhN (UPF0104 family)
VSPVANGEAVERIPPAPPRSWSLSRAIALVLALVLVGRVLWTADWAHTWALLRSVGPRLTLVLVPFILGMALDTAAWRLVLGRIGARVPYLPLLRIRVGSESLALSAPGGAVAAEAVKAVLLARRHAVSLSDGLASVAIKKIVYILAQGLYLAVGLAWGSEAIRLMAGGLGAGQQSPRWMPALQAAITFGMLGLGFALVLAWQRGGPAVLLLRIAGWFPSRRLARWLADRASQARAIDAAARSFFAGGARTIGPVLGLLFLQWLTEAGETYLALRLLHVEVSPFAVIAFEGLNSVARSVAIVVPAGLGIQELGQVLFVKAIGAPEPTAVAAALMLVKRGKDLVWSLTGYGLLGRAWRTA